MNNVLLTTLRLSIFISFIPLLSTFGNPSHVELVLGVSSGSYESRFSAVKNLLNGELVNYADQFIEFLISSQEDPNLSNSELMTIKNNLVDKMIALPELKSRFPEPLISVLKDQSQNVVWKDYVIQKCPRVLDFGTNNKKTELLDCLWNFTKDRKGTIAGTTLLALNQIAGSDPTLSRKRLGEIALLIASDSSYGEGNRLTALQIASSNEHRGAIPVAREILAKEKHATLLAMVAISVVSKDPDSENTALLRKCLKSSDFRLREAAKRALEPVGKL